MRVTVASSGIPPARGAGGGRAGVRAIVRTHATDGTLGSPGGAGRVGIQPSVLGSLSRGSGVCQRLSPNFPRTFPDTFPDRAAISHALPRRAKGTLSLIK